MGIDENGKELIARAMAVRIRMLTHGGSVKGAGVARVGVARYVARKDRMRFSSASSSVLKGRPVGGLV